MADDNRPLKYMRYAIGEIVLVVVGILIALQINTWNEERKGNSAKEDYVKSLIEELKGDTAYLNYYIKATSIETKRLKRIKIRMESREATIDTLFELWFSTSLKFPIDFKPLGDNIFKSLTSTGDIKLFNPNQTQRLIAFYDLRNSNQRRLDQYTNSKDDFEMLWEEVGILSKIKRDNLVYEALSKNIDTVQFLHLMDKYIANYRSTEINNASAQELLIKTEEMVNFLKSLKE